MNTFSPLIRSDIGTFIVPLTQYMACYLRHVTNILSIHESPHVGTHNFEQNNATIVRSQDFLSFFLLELSAGQIYAISPPSFVFFSLKRVFPPIREEREKEGREPFLLLSSDTFSEDSPSCTSMHSSTSLEFDEAESRRTSPESSASMSDSHHFQDTASSWP